MPTPATPKTKKPRTRNAKPKPPRRVRVAIKSPPITDSEAMFTFGNKLTSSADANPALLAASPYIPPLKTALVVLGGAITDAQGGTDADQTALVTATTKVHDLIVQHAGSVQGSANNLTAADAVNYITSAGFQVAATGQHARPSSPGLSNGTPNEVHFFYPRIPGFVMCFTEISPDGGVTFTRSVDTALSKGDLKGLTSGQKATIRLRAFVRGGAGYTPWTVLSIIVT